MTLIYRGSVKDIHQDGERLLFIYSDRYSVYDWGEMPDHIPHKGAALASLAASFFEWLQQRGVASHYLGQTGTGRIAVRPVQVLHPEWCDGRYDYTAYAATPEHALVPLEVIFRLRLAQGNSLQRRVAADPAYLAELGLGALPQGDTAFDPPLVEFSTKLESSDRYLYRREIEASRMATVPEIADLQRRTREVAGHLRALMQGLGIQLWDGKLEFGFGAAGAQGRDLFLVDSIGPDELRLTFEGLHLSKEFLRQFYAGSDWLRGVERAKALAHERGTRDWKAICRDELCLSPRALTAAELEVASLLYMALANAVAGEVGRGRPFDEGITLQRWAERARELLRDSARGGSPD